MSGQSRQIPQDTEKANKVVAGRSVGDLLLFIGLPVASIAALNVLGVITGIEFFIGLFATIGGAAILFRIIPSNESVTIRVRGIGHAFQLPTVARKFSKDADDKIAYDRGYEYDLDLRPDGGDSERAIDQSTSNQWWQTDETTVDQVGLDEIFPEQDVIRRSDGVYVAAVEVIGRDISLAGEAKVKKLTRQYASHLNNIDFSARTYITEGEFDIEDHIKDRRARLEDEDIQKRPILSELIRDDIRRFERSTDTSGLKQRRIFEIITVDPAEVTSIEEESSLIPGENDDGIVGWLRSLGGGDEAKEEYQAAEAQRVLNEIDSRVSTLISGIEAIDGVTTRQVDGQHLTELVANHYGQPTSSDTRWTPKQIPFVTGDDNESGTPDYDDLYEA